METPLQPKPGTGKTTPAAVTILILVETPLQHEIESEKLITKFVTILILVETPLQLLKTPDTLN